MHKSNKHQTAAQLSLKIERGWGGKRRGAGRPALLNQVNHAKRAKVTFKNPLHLTLKLTNKRWNLRCHPMAKLFKRSSQRAQAFGLNIVHYSLLRDHLHLIVEVGDNDKLARGMRSFGSSLAKQIRKVVGGRGAVFNGRFHMRIITNPTQMRNTLIYVLQNFSKHSKLLEHFDDFSSAYYFANWKKLGGHKLSPLLERWRKMPDLPNHLSPPRSWLAREGWQRGRALQFA